MKMKQYSEKQNAAWKRLSDEVGGQTGEALVLAMKSIYEMYTDDMIRWFAGLYDPKIGGYYYSESARDTEYTMRNDKRYDLLPDAESTYQAMSVFYLSGLMESKGNDRRQAIPEWMQEGIIKFIKSLQDPETGFFYHPQWGKEFTDCHVLRRARDLSWCTSLLTDFGSAPTYDAPNGTKGDGIAYDGTRVANITPCAAKSESSEEVDTAYYPPHLENAETFMQYLLKVEAERKGDFYGTGSQLTSESPQFVARDVQLAKEGKDFRLMDIVCDWLDTKQSPETGFWTSINGLLKVSGIYVRAKREIPRAELAVESALAFILSDKPAGSIVELYNPWHAIGNVIGTVRAYGKEAVIDGKVMSGAERAERMTRMVHASTPRTLPKTKEKLMPYAKPKGAFSYRPTGPAENSCSMPVTDYAVGEGDINATHLASTGLITGIYSGLGLSQYKVPIFGEAEYELYISILEENRKAALG